MQASSLAPPPDDSYAAVIDVEPGVFEDATLTEATALRVFAAWARRLPLAPDKVTDLVQSVEPKVRYVGRLASEIAERKVVWREAPHNGLVPTSGRAMLAESVDPWAVSAATLKHISQHVGACNTCSGHCQVACSACHGTTKITCSACKGAGKAYGYASNGSYRLMNCRTCKGKRELKCESCTKGLVMCGTCHGSGRMERWLEIVETVRQETRLGPDERLGCFPWARATAQASRATIELDAKILNEVSTHGQITKDELTRTMPRAWLDANWQKLQPSLRPGERVRAQTFVFVEIPSVDVAYAIRTAAPTVISFEGRRMLAPPASADRQFAARAQKVRLVRGAVFSVGALVLIVYLSRGSYFWNSWVAGIAASLAALLGVAEGATRHATLGRKLGRGWMIGAATAALLACVFAVGAEPSVSAAKRYISSGRLDQAEAELTALGQPTQPGLEDTWADLHLAQVQKLGNPQAAAQTAGQIPETLPQRAAAVQRVFELVRRDVDEALAARRPHDAETLIASTLPVLQRASALQGQTAELRGRVYDAEYADCATASCRWKAASDAFQMAPSEERTARLKAMREQVLADLSARPQAGDSSQSRLQKIDALAELATSVTETDSGAELATRAREASAWAGSARAAIPLVGADKRTAATLLGLANTHNTNNVWARVDNVSAYCAVSSERCTGVYLVGSEQGARVLSDSAHAAATRKILSQALGHAAELPTPPKAGGAQTTRWHDGAVPITARWSGSELVELRIGDAEP